MSLKPILLASRIVRGQQLRGSGLEDSRPTLERYEHALLRRKPIVVPIQQVQRIRTTQTKTYTAFRYTNFPEERSHS
jgi:hypothetical protein